jgi:hypothetical protein
LMIPDAHVYHRMPQRLRIKIPSKKGDVTYFAHLAEKIVACPGVRNARGNPKTASLLIQFECDLADLAVYAQTHRLFSLRHAEPHRRTLFGSVARSFDSYNRDLLKWTGGEFDIPSLVFVSLVISGLIQLYRGSVAMPAWYTAFYYALGVFSRSQVDEYDTGEDMLEGIEEAEGE